MSTPIEDFGQFMAWEGDELVVDTTDARARPLRKKALSPSTANAFDNCPAKWVVGQLLPRNDDPMSPQGKGTGSHAVLEELFDQPADQRTRVMAGQIIETIEQRKPGLQVPSDTLEMSKWRGILSANIAPLWDVLNPADIQVVHVERPTTGAQIEGVPINGFIDMQTTEQIIDWKFPGKPPREYSGKIQEYPEQLRMYALAVQDLDGELPKAAALGYINHTLLKPVSLKAKELEFTKRRVVDLWDKLGVATASGRYRATPHQFCSWCPLVSVCPANRDSERPAMAKTADAVLGVTMKIPTHAVRRTTTIDTDLEQDTLDMTYAEQPAYVETLPINSEGIDGSILNPNSYAAMGISGMLTKAYEVLSESGKVAPNAQTVLGLAQCFNFVINGVITRLGVDAPMNSGLHQRIRGFLYTRMDQRPIPLDDQEDMLAWLRASQEFCLLMTHNLFAVYDQGPTGAGLPVLFEPENRIAAPDAAQVA